MAAGSCPPVFVLLCTLCCDLTWGPTCKVMCDQDGEAGRSRGATQSASYITMDPTGEDLLACAWYWLCMLLMPMYLGPTWEPLVGVVAMYAIVRCQCRVGTCLLVHS